MPDVWAHCPECDRWFYPDEAVAHDGVLADSASAVAAPSNARCPVCSVRPDQLEDRAHGGAADASGRAPVGSPTAS